MNRTNKIVYSLIALIALLSFCCISYIKQDKQPEITFQDTWQSDNEFAMPDSFPELSVSIKSEDIRKEITIFNSVVDGNNYFFLPSYSSSNNVRLNVDSNKYEVLVNGIQVDPNLEMPYLVWNTPMELAIHNRENNTTESGIVYFLKAENIGSIYIDTESGSLDYLHEDKENKEPGDITVYNDTGLVQFDGKLEYLSGRGNETWTLSKRPYQFKLEDATDLFGMGKAKKWLLLANIQDGTFFKNKMVYDMAREVGMEYAAESCFVDLYVNSIYLGNYQVCEKIEIDPERVDIQDLESYNQKMNGKTDLNDLPMKESESGNYMKWVDIPNNPTDITGGYLIEHDYGDKFEAERCGFITDRGEVFAIKSPQNASYEEVKYIADYVQEFEDAIYSEDGINPKTKKKYTDYIDVDSFIKEYMIEEIVLNEGGGATSAWFYKPANNQSKKLYAGPVWDYDKAFGRFPKQYFEEPTGLSYLSYHWASSKWYKQLYQLDDYQSRIKDQYQTIFKPYLDDVLYNKMEEQKSFIQASAYMDHLRWGDETPRWQYQTFDESYEYVKNFMLEREKFLDDVWINNQTYYKVRFEVDSVIYEKRDVKPNETIKELPEMPYDEYEGIKGWMYVDTGEYLKETDTFDRDRVVYLVYEKKVEED